MTSQTYVAFPETACAAISSSLNDPQKGGVVSRPASRRLSQYRSPAMSSPGGRQLRGRALGGALPVFSFAQQYLTPVLRNLSSQRPSQTVADLDIHSSALSYASGLDGIDPNENGLTYEAQSLPPDGKAHD